MKDPIHTNLRDAVRYTLSGARAVRIEEGDFGLVGWVWRNESRRQVSWTFTRSLDQRDYPNEAVFIPVYAK